MIETSGVQNVAIVEIASDFMPIWGKLKLLKCYDLLHGDELRWSYDIE